MSDEKYKLRVLAKCRLRGKHVEENEVVEVSKEEARCLFSAGRAVLVGSTADEKLALGATAKQGGSLAFQEAERRAKK